MPGMQGAAGLLRRRPLWGFFTLTYLVSWAAWLPLLIDVRRTGETDSPLWWLHYLGGFGPMVAAFVMTAVLAGRSGMIRLVRRQAGLGTPKVWVLLGAVLPFIFFLLAWLFEGVVRRNWIELRLLLGSDCPGSDS